MVDVILEAGEGDIEEMGPSLTDDVILQTFPFSVIVPAVLEARNNLLASLKQKRGNDVIKIDNRHRNIGMALRAHSLDTLALDFRTTESGHILISTQNLPFISVDLYTSICFVNVLCILK